MSGLTPKIVAFATQKGGVGKTMTCWNIAGVLAKHGKKVLAIDLDPQSNLTSNFGLDNTELYPANNKPYGACQIFNTSNGAITDPKDVDINSVIVKSPLDDIMPNVDLIPSHLFLSKADTNLSQIAFKEKTLNRFLEYYSSIINQYDYILIDTAPNMFPVNQNAFLTADSIILLADPSIHSIDGMDMFIDTWSQVSKVAGIEFNINTIILNNVDMRSKQQEKFYSYCENNELLNAMLLDTFIPQAIELRNTEVNSIPIIFNEESKNKALRDRYEQIVKELEEREVL